MAKVRLPKEVFTVFSDRAYCINKLVDWFLVEQNPVADRNDKWRLDVEEIQSRLDRLKTEPAGFGTQSIPFYDRAWFCCLAVSELLTEEKQIIADKKAHKMADDAMCILHDLYQYLATKHFNNEQKHKPKPAGKRVREGIKRPLRKIRK